MSQTADALMQDDDLMVLLGDRRGNFVYANASYCRVSGYDWAELKGTAAARMVHKDTPMTVMADMATSIGATGQPWTGLIKNRRKTGEGYWLRLSISPLYAAGKFAGSLMVHSKPSAAEVSQIEPVYQRINSGKDKLLTIRHGKPIRLTHLGKLRIKWQSLGLKGLIWGTAVSVAAVTAGAFAWGTQAAPGSVGHWAALGLLVAAPLLGGGFLARAIVDPLRRAMRFANQVAAGDLVAQNNSSRSDEIGGLIRALSQMNVNMRATVMDVREGLHLMGRATSEIASGTLDLSGRTESQASALQQTAASMEEINTTVRNNADTARQARAVALSATEAAEMGGKVVGDVISTMDGISQSSRQIAEIIGVIDGIAFQTNILALNAAVEAARAGEQGRGFAVVASEVRNLAQRSAQSAKEIRALIAASVGRIEEGSQLVNSAGEAIGNIRMQVKQVTDLVEEIANASMEQSSGIGQINEAVTRLDQMTQQNSALVEQSTSSAESLAALAESLGDAVGLFKLSEKERQQLFQAAKKLAPQ